MREELITDESVQRSLDYLRDSAEEAAVARSQAKTLEKYLGVVEAEQKARNAYKSNAAAQDAARASNEYKQAIEAWKEAIRRDCEFSMLREAASARIEAWRSWSANNRAMEKLR